MIQLIMRPDAQDPGRPGKPVRNILCKIFPGKVALRRENQKVVASPRFQWEIRCGGLTSARAETHTLTSIQIG